MWDNRNFSRFRRKTNSEESDFVRFDEIDDMRGRIQHDDRRARG
jgi:hypothetical protein